MDCESVLPASSAKRVAITIAWLTDDIADTDCNGRTEPGINHLAEL
jgi:hypothetical protein